jgi:hypothetical protein
VPAEATRLKRRLGARDRWFLALLAFAALTGTVGALLLTHSGASLNAERDARCVEVIRASWMGGATFRYCGSDAEAFCRTGARGDRETTACERVAALPPG